MQPQPHRPHDTEFTPDDHEGFYSHHFFQPVDEARCTSAHRLIARVGWALDIAKEVKPRNILDLGSLDGSLLLTLTKQLGDQDVQTHGVGVDLSVEGVDLATDRAAKFELNCDFHQGTLEKYLEDAADDSFGMITMFEVIEHVEDPDWCIEQIHRVLAPGGTLLVSTPAFESPRFGMDDEANKCHIRLYTMQDEDYEAINHFGHTRRATSMPVQLKDFTPVSMEVFAELIHARVTK